MDNILTRPRAITRAPAGARRSGSEASGSRQCRRLGLVVLGERLQLALGQAALDQVPPAPTADRDIDESQSVAGLLAPQPPLGARGAAVGPERAALGPVVRGG